MGAMSAQNLFDTTIAGFENEDISQIAQKKAYCVETFYGNAGDSAFYRTTEKASAGLASMCVDADISAAKKLVYFTTLPTAETTITAGKYIISMKLFIETGNTMQTMLTEIGKNGATTSVTWDLSNLTQGEWITVKQAITIPTDIDVATANESRLGFKFPADANVTGKQKLYIDENSLTPDTYTMGTIEGNYTDLFYYGFEAGTTDEDGLYIPVKFTDYVSISDEKSADAGSNLYALKFDISKEATEANYSIQVGNNKADAAAGNLVLAAADYTASVKVYVDESNISEFSTAISTSTSNATLFQDIKWTIPTDIETGKWVTLTQTVTMATAIDSKITFKVLKNKIIDADKDALIYIDDLAFVDYVAPPAPTAEEIYSFDAPGVWFTAPAGDFFTVSSDQVLTGTSALKFNCTDKTLLPEVKLQLGLGKADVDNSYLVLDAGTYDVSFKVYIEPGCDVLGINMNIKDPFTTCPFDFAEVTKGQWVTLTSNVTIDLATADDCKFQIILPEAKYGEGTFYIDDITFATAIPTAINHKAITANLYPNPATGFVNIETTQGSRINIYSISGAKVKTISNAATLTTISTADMVKGMYLVSIVNNNGTTVKKLQVK